jgi:hypothetical protein
MQTAPTTKRSMPITFPVRGPAAWLGRNLRGDRSWIHRLSPNEIADLDVLVQRRQAGRLDFSQLTRDDAPLPTLGKTIARWLEEIRLGRGFVLVKGIPLDRYSPDEAAIAYWAIGLHLGLPKPQNKAGDLLGHVRDTGEIARDPNVRLYRTTKAQDFHTDGADIIGLLCLRPAKAGGLSRIVSSVSVVNEVARRRPDLAPLLFEDFPWDLTDDRALGSPSAVARFRICRAEGGELKTFFIGWYIRNAQRYPEVERLSDDQQTLIALMEEIANDENFHLDMDFEPGDIQFLDNATILHARTAYEDFAEPERKRHLLRLWLTARQ